MKTGSLKHERNLCFIPKLREPLKSYDMIIFALIGKTLLLRLE